MEFNESLYEFINNPDTVVFVGRQNEYFINFLKDRPEIVTTQILSGRYIFGYISRGKAQQLYDDLGTGVIGTRPLVLGLLDRTDLEAAGIIQVHEQPFLDLRGSGVIVGIVDTGIDYTNKAFIYEDGTSKIKFLYDQSIISTPPEGYFIGTEYTNEQINQALKVENPYDIVPSKDTVGHGTFLASVAAGREEGDYVGAAPDSELIIVKLKKARNYARERFLIPPEQENAFESSSVMLGIEYILNRAQELNRPVAICLGVGTNMGGHDGLTLFEEYLNIVSNIRGVCLCTAAGNESEARHHTQGVIKKADQFVPMQIKVGENAGDIYMSIWNGAADKMSVAIRSPTGEMIGRVPAKTGTFYQSKLVLEKSKVSVEYYFPVEGNGSQITVVKIYNATPGVWTVMVYGDIILDGTFHSWLPITGFVSPNVEFLVPIPNYTIVTPSTAMGVITCGAYDSSNNILYPKSSWGPTRLPKMAPDFVAPGVDVGGIYPTGPGTMSGTSVSSAITTGACALMLQWGVIEGNDLSMSTFQARAYIIRGCTRNSGLTYPNAQWGYGKINLIQSFNSMREV